MKRFIAIWILLSAGLNIWQMDRIRVLEEKHPMVIYKADNQGGFHVTNRDSVLMEDLLDGDSLDVTIIGNIYENPELLEVNHDTIR